MLTIGDSMADTLEPFEPCYIYIYRTDLKAGLMVACWSSLQAAISVGGPMLPVQCHEPQSGSVHTQKFGFRSSRTDTQIGKTKLSHEACCH